MLCDLFVMKCNMMMETDCIFFIHILHVLKIIFFDIGPPTAFLVKLDGEVRLPKISAF